MKKTLMALAILGALSSQAEAVVVCDSCSYLNGFAATNLGNYNPLTFDSATFSNSTIGQNGNFDNTWIFAINPGGNFSVDAIFLPTRNVSNFSVKLFNVTADACLPSFFVTGGACASKTLGSLVATGVNNTSFSSVIDLQPLAAGIYAFDVSGTISGLLAGQPAEYSGNLQVSEVSAVPEPETYALMLAGFAAVGYMARRRRLKQ